MIPTATPHEPGAPSSTRDYRLLLWARLVRAFGFGFVAVLLAIYLGREGDSAYQIGLVVGVALAASALLGLVFAAASRRLGRRACLVASGVLMAVSGLTLALGANGWVVFVAAATGMMGVSNIDIGPFFAVEQAVLAEAVAAPERNMAFARYSLSGGVASSAGALLAGLATTQERIQVLLVTYAAAGVVTSVLAGCLSPAVEGEMVATDATARGQRRLTRRIAPLTALFAVDSLGGGFVVPSVLALWLHVRFGLGAGTIGPAFAAVSLVQAVASELSGRLANRIGLVRTMVFTHLPSNVILLLVPLAPTSAWAIAMLIARATLSQMDAPARQAYVVSIVPPSERASAVAAVSAARGLAQTAGPVAAGVAIQGAALAVPFLVGGGLKVAYDLALFIGFRGRGGDHERRRFG